MAIIHTFGENEFMTNGGIDVWLGAHNKVVIDGYNAEVRGGPEGFVLHLDPDEAKEFIAKIQSVLDEISSLNK